MSHEAAQPQPENPEFRIQNPEETQNDRNREKGDFVATEFRKKRQKNRMKITELCGNFET